MADGPLKQMKHINMSYFVRYVLLKIENSLYILAMKIGPKFIIYKYIAHCNVILMFFSNLFLYLCLDIPIICSNFHLPNCANLLEQIETPINKLKLFLWSRFFFNNCNNFVSQ